MVAGLAKYCFLSMALGLCVPAYGSNPKVGDASGDSLAVFAQSIADAIPDQNPSAFSESTKYVWEKFKTTEVFSEELDAENKKTTRGYLTITFILPADLSATNDVLNKTIRHPKEPDPVLDFHVLRPDSNLKYKTGCLQSTLQALDGIRKVEMKLQIYEDTRLNRLLNGFRLGMPTASTHLNQEKLHRYLSYAFIGLFVEWMRQAVKNQPMVEQEFTKVICRDIAYYLRAQQKGYELRWKRPYTAMIELNPALEIVTGIDFHEEAVIPGLTKLLGHIASYTGSTSHRSIGQRLDDLYTQSMRARALVDPKPSVQVLGCLFNTQLIDGVSCTSFCYGNKNLYLYFARLAGLDPSLRQQELHFFIQDYFAFIPELLKMRTPQFIDIVRNTNLKDIAQKQLEEVQEGLIRTRKAIHDFAPADDSFLVQRKNPPARTKEEQAKPQSFEASPKDEFSILKNMLRRPPFNRLFWSFELIGYPSVKLGRGDLQFGLIIGDKIHNAFMDNLQKQLPQYFPSGLLMPPESPLPTPLRGTTINVPAFKGMSIWDKDKLGELWVTSLVDTLYRHCHIDQTNSRTHQYKFIEQIHTNLMTVLQEALVALGCTPSPKLLRQDLMDCSLGQYLKLLQSLKANVLVFLDHTNDNVRLFKMTMDLCTAQSFETYQPGALEFIAQSQHQVNPYLLQMFADCYYMRYLGSKLKHPLGDKINDQHAALLSAMLVPWSQEDRFMGADFKTKLAILEGFKVALGKAYTEFSTYAVKK